MLVGIAGLSGSGKDTVADFLVGYGKGLDLRVVKLPAADAIKKALLAMFGSGGLTPEQVYGPSALRAEPIPGLMRTNLAGGVEGVTIRRALQTLGTQWGRRYLGPDVWIDLTVRHAEQLIRSGQADIVVVPDVRFPNEMRAIRAHGYPLWHVVRGKSKRPRHVHVSEKYLYPPRLWERALFLRRWDVEIYRTKLIRNDRGVKNLAEAVEILARGLSR